MAESGAALFLEEAAEHEESGGEEEERAGFRCDAGVACRRKAGLRVVEDIDAVASGADGVAVSGEVGHRCQVAVIAVGVGKQVGIPYDGCDVLIDGIVAIAAASDLR